MRPVRNVDIVVQFLSLVCGAEINVPSLTTLLADIPIFVSFILEEKQRISTLCGFINYKTVSLDMCLLCFVSLFLLRK